MKQADISRPGTVIAGLIHTIANPQRKILMSNVQHSHINSFDKNWKQRKESFYTHWSKGKILNQIQLAFRNHWSLLCELMKNPDFNQGKRVLEVGCGRGSLSCYFSNAGYDCMLLDISEGAIDIAQEIFKTNSLKATFKVGDVNTLPFEKKSFDVVFSIGLLEHLEDIEAPIKEQIRVLDDGGLFFGYIVPEYSDNIQKDYEWVNDILKGYAEDTAAEKEEVYRSDAGSEYYLPILKRYKLKDIQASGVYPLPMISHSKKFPFTLMPKESEKALVKQLEKMLEENGRKTGKHSWLCDEGYGQAFIIWGYK